MKSWPSSRANHHAPGMAESHPKIPENKYEPERPYHIDTFRNEITQCVEGRRGWVNCSKARAKRFCLEPYDLVEHAKLKGLHTAVHGKYGWIASRIPNED
ncbi:hypothetical protein CCP4SC76_6730002 [Gammaproteobacteria bacterium]